MRKMWALAGVTAVLLAGLWLALSGGTEADAAPATSAESASETTPSEAEPVALVAVERAVSRNVGAVLWVPGTLVSRHDAEIAAEVAGPLVAVAEVGDTVAAGEVLALVDDGALQLRLRADEAEIRRLEAQMEYLDRRLRRVDALSRQEIATRNQLDELTSERAMAEQALESARIERDTTRFLIERSSLRAPFPGRVVARLAVPGGYVSVGQAVVRVVDTGHAEVRAQAPLQAALRVREGMELDVEGPGLGGGEGPRRRVGAVRAAVPVGDERSRMFELRIVLADAEGDPATGWPVGAPLRIALPAGEARAGGVGAASDVAVVAVPRDALVLRRDATYVFIARDDGTAQRVEVLPGAGDGEMIEVRGDVHDGDRVIVRGAERLEDGARVQVRD